MRQSEEWKDRLSISTFLMYFIITLHKGNPDLTEDREFWHSTDSRRSIKINAIK